jgi:ATP dependent DNA ligase-like protein
VLVLGGQSFRTELQAYPRTPEPAPCRFNGERDSPRSERGGNPPLMVSRSPSWHPTGFIEPCLPTPSRSVPDGPRWAFEVKHDGFRFIARRDGDRVWVFSRHGKDRTDKVPAIVEGMLALPVSATGLAPSNSPCIRRAFH